MRTAEALKQNVEQELNWEPSICADKIGLSVNNGVVKLDGHVDSLYQKWAAEQAALRVAMFRRSQAKLSSTPFESERTDEQIAAAAGDHLA